MADVLTAPVSGDHDDGDHGHDDHHEEHLPTNTGLTHNKLGMWVFLGSECLLFGGLISTYLLLKGRFEGQVESGDITGEAAVGPEIFDIWFTSLSSFVLLMSSLTMVLAVSAANRGDQVRTRLWLSTTALLGSVFIACLLYTSPSPRDATLSRMPSSA